MPLKINRWEVSPLVHIYLVFFFSMLAYNAIETFLPTHLKALGMDEFEISLAINSIYFTLFLFQPFAGSLADKFGRKRCLLLGLAAYPLYAFAVALSSQLSVLLLAGFVLGIGAALFWNAGIVYVFDASEPRFVGRAIGSFMMFPTVGAFFSGLLGAAMVKHFGFETNALAAGAVLVVTFSFAMLLKEEKRRAVTVPTKKIVEIKNVLLLLLMINLFTGIYLGVLRTYMPLYISSFGGTEMEIGVYKAIAAVSGLFYPLMGRISEANPLKTLLLALGIETFSLAGVAFAPSLSVLFAFFFLKSIASGLGMAAHTTLVGSLSEEHRGKFIGYTGLFSGFSGVAGAVLLANYAAQNMRIPFEACVLGYAIAFAVQVAVVKKWK